MPCSIPETRDMARALGMYGIPQRGLDSLPAADNAARVADRLPPTMNAPTSDAARPPAVAVIATSAAAASLPRLDANAPPSMFNSPYADNIPPGSLPPYPFHHPPRVESTLPLALDPRSRTLRRAYAAFFHRQSGANLAILVEIANVTPGELIFKMFADAFLQTRYARVLWDQIRLHRYLGIPLTWPNVYQLRNPGYVTGQLPHRSPCPRFPWGHYVLDGIEHARQYISVLPKAAFDLSVDLGSLMGDAGTSFRDNAVSIGSSTHTSPRPHPTNPGPLTPAQDSKPERAQKRKGPEEEEQPVSVAEKPTQTGKIPVITIDDDSDSERPEKRLAKKRKTGKDIGTGVDSPLQFKRIPTTLFDGQRPEETNSVLPGLPQDQHSHASAKKAAADKPAMIKISPVQADSGLLCLISNRISTEELVAINNVRLNLLKRARPINSLGDIVELIKDYYLVSTQDRVPSAFEGFEASCRLQSQLFDQYSGEDIARYFAWAVNRYLDTSKRPDTFFPFLTTHVDGVEEMMLLMKEDAEELDVWKTSVPKKTDTGKGR